MKVYQLSTEQAAPILALLAALPPSALIEQQQMAPEDLTQLRPDDGEESVVIIVS